MTNPGQSLRFATVGGCVALIYVLLYMFLVGGGLSFWWANLIAFLTATIVQYVGQTCWTFRKPLVAPSQIGRFLTLIAIGLGSSALITNILSPKFGNNDWIAACLVAVMLPALNYFVMNLWVFNSKNEFDSIS